MALLWRWLVCRRPCRTRTPLGIDFLASPSRSRRPDQPQSEGPRSASEPVRELRPGHGAVPLMPPCVRDIGGAVPAPSQFMSVASAAFKARAARQG